MLNPLFLLGIPQKISTKFTQKKPLSTKAWLPTMMIFEIIILIGMEGNSTTCIFFIILKNILPSPNCLGWGADNI